MLGSSMPGVNFCIGQYTFVPSGNRGEVFVDLGDQEGLIQRGSEFRNALASASSDLFYPVREPLVNLDCKLLCHGNVSSMTVTY